MFSQCFSSFPQHSAGCFASTFNHSGWLFHDHCWIMSWFPWTLHQNLIRLVNIFINLASMGCAWSTFSILVRNICFHSVSACFHSTRRDVSHQHLIILDDYFMIIVESFHDFHKLCIRISSVWSMFASTMHRWDARDSLLGFLHIFAVFSLFPEHPVGCFASICHQSGWLFHDHCWII